MELRFIGCGDAFASGGRFNTCFLVSGAAHRFLIDCGASSLVALRQAGIDLAGIDAVIVSHLHGDHFGGLPFLLLDAAKMSRRTRPLVLYGPAGLQPRLEALQEALYPGLSTAELGFALSYRVLEAGDRCTGDGLAVTPYLAEHAAGAPCFSLRVECEGKVIAYSGDTGWTEELLKAARDADLFVCECSSFDRPLKGHLDYLSLAPQLERVGAKRVILTHLGPDMIERRSVLAHETASDGMIVVL